MLYFDKCNVVDLQKNKKQSHFKHTTDYNITFDPGISSF